MFLSRLREFESLVLVYYQNCDCFWYAERQQSLCDIYIGSFCLRIWLLGIFIMWSGISLQQSGILSIWSTIISYFSGFYKHVEYYYNSFVYIIYLNFYLQKKMVNHTRDYSWRLVIIPSVTVDLMKWFFFRLVMISDFCLVGHPPLYVTFSVRPSVLLSVAHHISRTIHHLTIIFGTHI